MKNDLILKIIFALVCVILVLFFGLGVYFCVARNDEYHFMIGSIGVGVSFIGAGITGLLGDGVLFNKRPIVSRKVVRRAPTAAPVQNVFSDVRTTAMVQVDADIPKTSSNAIVHAMEDYVEISNVYSVPVQLKYSSITDFYRVKEQVRFSSRFSVGNRWHEGQFVVTMPSSLKSKAFEQVVLKMSPDSAMKTDDK